MDDQPDIMAVAPVAFTDHAHVFDHGISPALCYHIHSPGQIYQTFDRAHCHPVVHWNDYSFAGCPIHDPFLADLLANTHYFILPL